MASSNNGDGGGGGGDEQLEKMAKLSETLKPGERILAPTRRPDGTLRKPIKIRAGHTPQDEVAIYKSKGALWKKEMTAAQEVPPGYDPVPETKPKTKAVKRNERKKEKRLQAALEKGKNSEAIADGDTNKGEVLTAETLDHASKSVASLTSQMNELAVTPNSVLVSPPAENAEVSESGVTFQDIDKKIRAIKKKIRLAEGQIQKTSAQDMKPEQLEKITKLEGWREELKLLESKKAEQAASS